VWWHGGETQQKTARQTERKERGLVVEGMVERQPGKCEALSSNLSSAKKKRKARTPCIENHSYSFER
jgi:hypothetical protein